MLREFVARNARAIASSIFQTNTHFNIFAAAARIVAVAFALVLPCSPAFALLGSSTTVISSVNPSALGQSVTFTATVNGVILTPTGTVTFKDGATTLGSGTLNGSGQATFSTNALTAGSHSITVEYGGDTIYNPSTSSPLTQTVNQSLSTTSLVSSINPSALTQSVTFTATVSGPGGTPTGTVTFKDGSATLGTGTLNGSGQATFSTALLLPGGHSITAVYSGDSNFSASLSSPLTQTVSIGATTTSVVSSVNPSALGQSVTFTATVTGLILAPSGTVTFKDGSTTLGTGTLNASGQATLTTSALAVGAHSITVEYGGDLIYGASTSSPLVQNVNQSSSSTTLMSSANPSALTQSVTFTATVTGSGGIPTGSVTFKDGSTTLGTGTLNGSGQATFSSGLLLPGTHSITAVYGGDTNYAASTSGPLSQVVTIAPTTTTLVSSANPSSLGQSVTFTATVTGLILAPTGTVTFKDGSTTLGTGTLNGSGQATFSNSALTAGSHSITAVYGGDLLYASSTSSPLTQSVNQSSSATSVVSSINPSALTQSVTFTATVTGSGGMPTGTVTFKDGSATLGVGTLNGSGQTTLSTSTLLPGGHTITAVYSGDSTYATSTSSPLTQTVTIGATTTAISSSVNPSAFGQSVTFTATVTGLLLTPSGTVTFKDGSTILGTGTLNGSGQATFTTSALTTGSHPITAEYGGDLIFAASTSSPLTQTVTQSGTTVALISSLNPSAMGQSVTFTATVTGSGAMPTGTVTFKDGSTAIGSGTLNGSGQAVIATAGLAVGSHSITATYNGDSNYATSVSPALTQNVTSNSSATSLTSSLNPSSLGQSVTFTANVSGSGALPTGTVTFKDGATTLGTGTLDGSGQATFTTNGLTAGSHAMTAVYGGDASHGSSTSPVLTQTVNGAASSVALASSVNPSAPNQLVVFTATVSGSGGVPTGTVTFKDGSATLGTGTLNGSGQATFSTSSLASGTHPITAAYGGNAQYVASTSAVLNQSVGTPPDSTKLREFQLAATKVEAQSSGQAISGAMDNAVADAFTDQPRVVASNGYGFRFNFVDETPPASRVSDAFATMSGAPTTTSSVRPPREWLAWADIRGIGWNTSASAGDLQGGQINSQAGLTYKFTPNVAFGIIGGYESFDYRSVSIDGRLVGNGWTVGGYSGWRISPNIKFTAGAAYSSVEYNMTVATASAVVPATRWLANAALTGTYPIDRNITIEPSLRAFALWEQQKSYVDSLGTSQADHSFVTGRASAGVKATYQTSFLGDTMVAPYSGVYSDYYYTKDTVGAALPEEFLRGWSARFVSGVAFTTKGGALLGFDGEVGGIGSGEFINWSMRGRALIPF